MLEVTVVTSDFHVARTRAVFEWVLGVEPSLLRPTEEPGDRGRSLRMSFVGVDSENDISPTELQHMARRRAHEEAGYCGSPCARRYPKGSQDPKGRLYGTLCFLLSPVVAFSVCPLGVSGLLMTAD